MCGNAAGHMIKPDLVYKAANPWLSMTETRIFCLFTGCITRRPGPPRWGGICTTLVCSSRFSCSSTMMDLLRTFSSMRGMCRLNICLPTPLPSSSLWIRVWSGPSRHYTQKIVVFGVGFICSQFRLTHGGGSLLLRIVGLHCTTMLYIVQLYTSFVMCFLQFTIIHRWLRGAALVTEVVLEVMVEVAAPQVMTATKVMTQSPRGVSSVPPTSGIRHHHLLSPSLPTISLVWLIHSLKSVF